MNFTNVSTGISHFQMPYINNHNRNLGKFNENFCRGVGFRNVQDKWTSLSLKLRKLLKRKLLKMNPEPIRKIRFINLFNNVVASLKDSQIDKLLKSPVWELTFIKRGGCLSTEQPHLTSLKNTIPKAFIYSQSCHFSEQFWITIFFFFFVC